MHACRSSGHKSLLLLLLLILLGTLHSVMMPCPQLVFPQPLSPCSGQQHVWRHAGVGGPRAAAGRPLHQQDRHLLTGGGKLARGGWLRLPCQQPGIVFCERPHCRAAATGMRACMPSSMCAALPQVLWELATREVPRRGFVQPPPPSDDCPQVRTGSSSALGCGLVRTLHWWLLPCAELAGGSC